MADIQQRAANRTDSAAFREIYSEFAPRVKTYLMRNGASADIADDLAQQVLMSAWHKLSLASPNKRTVGADIFAAARNLCIDRLRERFVWQLNTDEGWLIQQESQAAENISARIRHRAAIQALEAMPVADRDYLTLALLDGLSIEQIAKRKNICTDQVRADITKAYARLGTINQTLRSAGSGK